MSLPKLFLLCARVVCQAVDAHCQALPPITIIPLTVEKGVPLQVVLTSEVRLKVNEPVRAKVIEPVYAFDREVIPSGAQVLGRITGFSKTSKWKRVSRMLGGDFTPIRVPEITFDKLVLAGCEEISIETLVVPASETLVLVEGVKDKSSKDLKDSLKAAVSGSSKGMFGKLLWGMSPYRPQSMSDQTPFKLVLQAPLQFGAAILAPDALSQIGSHIPPESIATARLITPLDSRTSQPGMPIEAVLTYPIFSSDDWLVYPVGSKLRGEVIEAGAARMRHRNGHLAFRFTTIEPPVLVTRPMQEAKGIEASFLSIHAAGHANDLRINEAGEAWIAKSKARFFAPAMAFVNVFRAAVADPDPFDQALLGAYRSKFLNQITGGNGSGFGLPASITGAMVPQVKLGLGVYGAARSIYTHFLGRGDDVTFPATTSFQLRLEDREGEGDPAENPEEDPE
jgi:hypothetical protein